MNGQFSLNLPLDTQIRRFALVMVTPLEYPLFSYDVTLFVTGGSTIGGFPLGGSSSI